MDGNLLPRVETVVALVFRHGLMGTRRFYPAGCAKARQTACNMLWRLEICDGGSILSGQHLNDTHRC